MDANMRARGQLRDYIKHTAVVNPHARIELHEPDGEFKAERADGAELPAETEEIRPHPHGVELGTLMKMLDDTDSYSLSGFLQEEFTRVGKKTAANVIAAFNDRHYGREMAWRVSRLGGEDVETAVADAVANKGQEATAAFASHVADAVGETTGSPTTNSKPSWRRRRTRRKPTPARRSARRCVRRPSRRRGRSCGRTGQRDLYELVDAATSTRKDSSTIEPFADRLAAKFETSRDRLRREDLVEYVDRAAAMTEERDDVSVRRDRPRERRRGRLGGLSCGARRPAERATRWPATATPRARC